MPVLPSLLVRPPAMTTYSPVYDSYHMCIVQSMFTTECGQIGDWSDMRTFRINEPVISFHVIPLPNAVFVRPPFIRFQLALPNRQPMHRRKIQASLTAKFI